MYKKNACIIPCNNAKRLWNTRCDRWKGNDKFTHMARTCVSQFEFNSMNRIQHQHSTSISNAIFGTIFPFIYYTYNKNNIDSSWFGSNPELIVKHCDNRQCHNLHTYSTPHCNFMKIIL